MDQLTLLNVILLVCGIALNLLMRLNKSSKMKGFSLTKWMKENWITMAITLISAFVSLIMAEDLVKALGMIGSDGAPFYSVHAFLSGLLPHVIIDKVKNMIK